ncbi:translation initiation factor IF-3 [Aminobacterium mobile]|uniref:translation initiation factor IF-3 n=1 Tax=Aminobacterium mobile TaxID=81467 RepID=UPI0033158C20
MAKREEGEPRVNEEITAREVLLIDENGVKVGVTAVEEALRMAEERGLDLVEVAPQAKVPVCRILDYGKYRYQQQKKEKDARKKQKGQTLKEMKMRPKIDEHDYDFKVRAVQNFLKNGHRVKVSVFFRGREMAFLDKGREVLERVIRDCEGLGKHEGEPRMEGRYMRIMITPAGPVKPKEGSNKQPKKDQNNQNTDNPNQGSSSGKTE